MTHEHPPPGYRCDSPCCCAVVHLSLLLLFHHPGGHTRRLIQTCGNRESMRVIRSCGFGVHNRVRPANSGTRDHIGKKSPNRGFKTALIHAAADVLFTVAGSVERPEPVVATEAPASGFYGRTCQQRREGVSRRCRPCSCVFRPSKLFLLLLLTAHVLRYPSCSQEICSPLSPLTSDSSICSRDRHPAASLVPERIPAGCCPALQRP